MEKTEEKWKFEKVIALDRDENAFWEIEKYLEDSAVVSELIMIKLSERDKVLKDLKAISHPSRVPELLIFNVIMPTDTCLDFVEKFDALPDLVKNNCRILLMSAFYSDTNYDDILLGILKYPFIMGILEAPMNGPKLNKVLTKYDYKSISAWRR